MDVKGLLLVKSDLAKVHLLVPHVSDKHRVVGDLLVICSRDPVQMDHQPSADLIQL